MKIPKFWSKASASGAGDGGRAVEFSCWRCSDVSEADAHESALSAAKRVVDAILAGRRLDRYEYGCVPLREEVTNRMEDGAGNTIAVVTRNVYGSLVLNAARVMFVDIDFPPVSAGEAIKHFFARLFGRAKETPEAIREEQARGGIERFVECRPGWGVRVYRTFGGLRAIATHDVFDPADEATLESLRQMGSDPLYVRLCKAQECFRARLTPKPWRCGHWASGQKHPIADDAAADRHEKWKAAYDVCHREFATCRFVTSLGNGDIHPEVQSVVELHDFATRCREKMPLA